MRMITLALLSLAYLCGSATGVIAGLILAWNLFRKRPEADPDYSGGM